MRLGGKSLATSVHGSAVLRICPAPTPTGPAKGASANRRCSARAPKPSLYGAPSHPDGALGQPHSPSSPRDKTCIFPAGCSGCSFRPVSEARCGRPRWRPRRGQPRYRGGTAARPGGLRTAASASPSAAVSRAAPACAATERAATSLDGGGSEDASASDHIAPASVAQAIRWAGGRGSAT